MSGAKAALVATAILLCPLQSHAEDLLSKYHTIGKDRLVCRSAHSLMQILEAVTNRDTKTIKAILSDHDCGKTTRKLAIDPQFVIQTDPDTWTDPMEVMIGTHIHPFWILLGEASP